MYGSLHEFEEMLGMSWLEPGVESTKEKNKNISILISQKTLVNFHFMQSMESISLVKIISFSFIRICDSQETWSMSTGDFNFLCFGVIKSQY